MSEQTSHNSSPAVSVLGQNATGIDHIAIAVRDLETSLSWFTNVLGFEMKERRRTEGKTSGMISAVLNSGPLKIVLLQGTSEESQVQQFVRTYGPGVQHVAVAVRNLSEVVEQLACQGMEFETSIVGNSGLRQIFSKRDEKSGLMLELLERNGEGFSDENVSGLFAQLEAKSSF